LITCNQLVVFLRWIYTLVLTSVAMVTKTHLAHTNT